MVAAARLTRHGSGRPRSAGRSARDPFSAAYTRARRGLLSLFVGVIGLIFVTSFLQGGGATAPDSPRFTPGTPEGVRAGQFISPVDVPRDAVVASAIDLDAPLIDIALSPDRVLTPPDDVDMVGWWDASALPGAVSGQTIITGHTVHTGGGVLNRLADLSSGDGVSVTRHGRETDYVVTGSEKVSVAELADRSEELFGQDVAAPARLVLITCSDWDGTDYQSNTLVYAEPVGGFRAGSPGGSGDTGDSGDGSSAALADGVGVG